MDKEDKELIKLTAKEILLSFLDFGMKINEICGYKMHRRIAKEYFKSRDIDRDYFYKKLWELEKRGYIKRYKNEKKNFIDLTPEGEKQVLKYISAEYKIKSPKKWDKKWHIIIFDIPEEKKVLREIVRNKLKQLDFFQLQKSVFVHPFECQEIIASLKYIYGLNKYVQYIIADNIETEIDLLSHFYDLGILPEK